MRWRNQWMEHYRTNRKLNTARSYAPNREFHVHCPVSLYLLSFVYNQRYHSNKRNESFPTVYVRRVSGGRVEQAFGHSTRSRKQDTTAGDPRRTAGGASRGDFYKLSSVLARGSSDEMPSRAESRAHREPSK